MLRSRVAGHDSAGQFLIALFLVAFNLRPVITSVPPILAEVEHAYGLGSAAVTALVTTPVVVLGLAAAVGPWLARRWGSHVGISIGLLLVAGGAASRGGGPVMLFIGTAVSAAGITVLGVLLPSLVKQWNPARAGLATSVYACALALGATIGPAITPWLSGAGDTSARLSLAIWAAPALLALLFWRQSGNNQLAIAEPTPGGRPRVLRSGTAWAVTVFFAAQATLFFTLVSWLPAVWRSRGASADQAGLLLALFSAVSLLANLLVPACASRMRAQRTMGVVLSLIGGAGIVLALISANPLLTMTVLGLGQGGAFPYALTLLALRAADARAAACLSALAQGVGFTLAAAGPLLFGVLHDTTGNWTAPLLGILPLTALEAAAAIYAGRPGPSSTQPQAASQSAPTSGGPVSATGGAGLG